MCPMRDLNPLVECFRFRHLFFGLVQRDISLRYRGSMLGLAWAFLNPVLQLATYTLLFSVFLRIGIANYPAFALAAFLPWIWFSTSVQMASRSILANSALIKKIYFPSELLPLVSVTSNLVNFLMALPILFVLLLALHLPFTPALLALPALLAIQFVFTAAVSLAVAALNTFYRDAEHVLGLILMMWLYMTPVLYPASFVPAPLVPFLGINPMFHLVEGYRSVLVAGQWPPAAGLAYAATASVVLAALAGLYFNHRKPIFAEVL